MESETASSADEHVGPSDGVGGSNDNRGKHRILAELKHLEQELKCLEEELEELEKTENASTIYAALLSHTESTSDPLLPVSYLITQNNRPGKRVMGSMVRGAAGFTRL